MVDDDSNDVMSVHSNDGYSAEDFAQAANEKPLMTLFKRLIGNNSKENTVLTNAQIKDIYKKEFNMDLSCIHELEIEIYLNLMKKFLKDWPLWDEFDQSIQSLKNKNDTTSIKVKLETNHKNLKNYLSQMLDAAKPYMKNVVDFAKESSSKVSTSKESNSNGKDKTDNMDSDVVLEIQCSRQQLNQLFFRRPNPEYNNTIFNVQTPNKISVTSFSLRSILNWPGIKLSVNLGSTLFRRESVHVLKHKLVNKKLNHVREPPTPLDMGLQMKDLKPMTSYTVKVLCQLFNCSNITNRFQKRIMEEIQYLLSVDFGNAPDVKITPLYRRVLNKYPYIRYLYSDVTQQPTTYNAYDLQLEETMTPMFNLCILKFDMVATKPIEVSIAIDCVPCGVSFNATEGSELWQHFEIEHQGEPDWQCTNCNNTFSVKFLAESHWNHDCPK